MWMSNLTAASVSRWRAKYAHASCCRRPTRHASLLQASLLIPTLNQVTDRSEIDVPCPPGLQEIAAKAEVAAQRAKEAQAHRKEFIAERSNAARDARALRNRGGWVGRGGLRCGG